MQIALNHLELQEADGKLLIVYQCKDQTPFKYNIDTKLFTEDDWQIDKNFKSRAKRGGFPVSSDTALKLVSWTGGALTAKDLWEAARRRKGKKEAASSLLGAASGYSLGYQMASIWEPDCENVSVTSLLEDPQAWETLEKIVYVENHNQVQKSAAISVLEDTLTNDPGISVNEKKEISDAVKAFSAGSSIAPQLGLKSGDFEELVKTKTFGKKYLLPYRVRQRTPSISPISSN